MAHIRTLFFLLFGLSTLGWADPIDDAIKAVDDQAARSRNEDVEANNAIQMPTLKAMGALLSGLPNDNLPTSAHLSKDQLSTFSELNFKSKAFQAANLLKSERERDLDVIEEVLCADKVVERQEAGEFKDQIPTQLSTAQTHSFLWIVALGQYLQKNQVVRSLHTDPLVTDSLLKLQTSIATQLQSTTAPEAKSFLASEYFVIEALIRYDENSQNALSTGLMYLAESPGDVDYCSQKWQEAALGMTKDEQAVERTWDSINKEMPSAAATELFQISAALDQAKQKKVGQ